MIEIWTDGATSNNGKKNAIGGWAYVIVKDGEELCHGSGAEKGATNNRCEYLGMLEGLKELERRVDLTQHECISCFSDSALLINTLTRWIFSWKERGWRRKDGPVKNLELVQELYPYAVSSKFKFYHVKGHAGIKWNEKCDQLAVAARLNLEDKE